METLHGRHHYTADQNKGSPLTLRRDQDQVSPYNITPACENRQNEHQLKQFLIETQIHFVHDLRNV